MKWSDVFGEQTGTQYGPDIFKDILKHAFVDPYNAEIVAAYDFPKLIKIVRNLGYFEGAEWISIGNVIELQSDEDEKKDIAKIFEETDKDTIETLGFIIALWILAIQTISDMEIESEKLKNEKFEEIQQQFNENNLSIGAQFAFWYMYHEGVNTKLGEKIKKIADEHVSDVYSQ